MTAKQAKPYFSMTAYASVDFNFESRSYKLNIRSVNHKNLKLNIRHPFSFQTEDRIRNIVRKNIARGAVDLIIEENQIQSDSDNFTTWIEECKTQNLPSPSWSDFFLKCQMARKLDGLNQDEEQNILPVLEDALTLLIEQFTQHRQIEGGELIKCIDTYLDDIKKSIGNIIKMLPGIHEEKKNQLKARIDEVSTLLNTSIKEEDLMREIAILIDKLNVTEECDRILVHLNNFNNALFKDNKDGKYLDFLCQEINREINTLTTKSQSTAISECCIQMKSDLEKIREQVQNLA